jgi:hypothetical protein
MAISSKPTSGPAGLRPGAHSFRVAIHPPAMVLPLLRRAHLRFKAYAEFHSPGTT